MNSKQAILLVLAVSLLVACPESGNDSSDVNSNGAVNAQTNGATNSLTNGVSNGATNSGTNVELPDYVEFIELEWGLTEGFQARSFRSETEDRGYLASAVVDLPAGVFTLRALTPQGAVIDTTDTGADRLVPLTGDVTNQPFFNPAPTTVTVEIQYEAGAWAATIGPRTEGDDLAFDDPEAPGNVGPWFEEAFEQVLDADDRGGAVVELMHAIREHGGPVHTDDGVLFIAPAQEGEAAPQIRGTWNNFQADPASELHRITPGFWARFIQMPPGRHEYKIFYPAGDAWVTDISNPHIAWDGFDPNTVGSFNSVIRPTGPRTVWMPQTHSLELGNTREAYVHLPASYDVDSPKRYPVLYVHDGNESIVRGQFQIVADEAAEGDGATEAILVFLALPSQNVRIDEYTLGTAGSLGDLYVEFVAETLVPQVDAQFRTRTERAARGITGASLGGLISFWGAMQYPAVFGYTAGMSSSFFWGDNFLIGEVQTRGCQDVSYYLDSGSPADNFDVTELMRDVLDGMGCEYEYVLDPGGQHDWTYWRGRFGGVLSDFARTHGG